MTRYIWDKARSQWVTPERRVVSAGPNIISDNIDWYNHATGKRYTSKRAYYREGVAAGYEIYDKPYPPDPKPKDYSTGADIRRDMRAAAAKYGINF